MKPVLTSPRVRSLPGRGRRGPEPDRRSDGTGPAPSLRLLLRLGRRLIRSRSLAASAWLMAAVGATVVAAFVVLSSLTLSGDQVVERDMGRFRFASDLTNLVALTPGNVSLTAEVESAALAAGATGPMVTLTSVAVEPAQADPPHTWYTEADWARDPFPRRYVLLEGRWPERPGEVVLTRTASGALASLGEPLAVLAGHERFAVVGLADDRYGEYHAILAAPGTFAGIGEAALRSFPGLTAGAKLYWEGGERRPVIDAMSTSLARSLSRPRDEVAQLLEAFTQDRAQAKRAVERPWIDRIPSGYAVPALLLPILASLATFGLGGRRLRRSGDLLVAVGMPPARAALALGLAVTGRLVASLAGGIAVGIVVGLAGRLVIARYQWWAQALSPFPGVIDPVVRLGASAVAASIVGTGLLRFVLAGGRRDRAPAARGTRSDGPKYRRHATNIRHGIAVLAACAAIVQASRLDRTAEAMVLAGTVAVTVLLLVPELVEWVLRALPRTDPRLRLARQHLLHDRLRGSIAVAVLAAALGLPLGYLALLDTMIQTAEEGLGPEVAPGQLLVSELGGANPTRSAVLAVVSDRLGPARPPVRLRHLGAEGQGLSVEVQGSGFRFVLALDTADDVGRLLGRPLTPAERSVLVDGGLLAWDGRAGGERVLVRVDGTGAGSGEVRLPAVAARVHPAWRRSFNGVVLRATAERLGLPVSDGDVLFTGVSDAEAQAARQAVLDAGLDPYYVRIHEALQLYVPRALFAAAAGLLLTVLLCSVAVSRAQVVTLRRYLGTLVAIGLTPSWARQVVLLQSAFVAAMATVVALALAIPPVVIAAWRIPDWVLSIPWRVIGLVVAACYLAVLLASILSCRQIRAADRAAV